MLQDKLETSIADFMMDSKFLDPRGIIVRAETWWELLSQVGIDKPMMSIFDLGRSLYKGIKVYRSNDISRDEFIIF